MGNDDSAADWFARMHGPGAAAARASFEQWYAEPANASAYDHLTRTWDQAKFLANTPTGRARNLDLARSRGSGRRRAIALAATIALAAALCAMIVGRIPYLDRHGQVRAVATETASRADARRMIVLTDGSRVLLDRASRLGIAFTQSTRRLRLLAGRARFDVAHDPHRSFIVEAGGGSVIAHGTMFDVALGAHSVRVVLLRGSVEVRAISARAAPGPVRQLIPGQKILIAGGALTRPVAATMRDLQWSPPMIEFDGTPLTDAVAAFNRTSDLAIHVDSPGAAQLRVTGAFRRDDAPAFAASLAAAFGLDVQQNGGRSLTLVARQSAAQEKKP